MALHLNNWSDFDQGGQKYLVVYFTVFQLISSADSLYFRKFKKSNEQAVFLQAAGSKLLKFIPHISDSCRYEIFVDVILKYSNLKKKCMTAYGPSETKCFPLVFCEEYKDD